jgi:hypothetical protein
VLWCGCWCRGPPPPAGGGGGGGEGRKKGREGERRESAARTSWEKEKLRGSMCGCQAAAVKEGMGHDIDDDVTCCV